MLGLCTINVSAEPASAASTDSTGASTTRDRLALRELVEDWIGSNV